MDSGKVKEEGAVDRVGVEVAGDILSMAGTLCTVEVLDRLEVAGTALVVQQWDMPLEEG